jgi:hypothetical protein
VTVTTKGQGNWLLGAAILASTYKDCKGFSNSILKHCKVDHTKGQGGGEELVRRIRQYILMDFNYLATTISHLLVFPPIAQVTAAAKGQGKLPLWAAIFMSRF